MTVLEIFNKHRSKLTNYKARLLGEIESGNITASEAISQAFGYAGATVAVHYEHQQRVEINSLRAAVREYERRFREGRDYLMSVKSDAITVEDALEAFGWTRDGMTR